MPALAFALLPHRRHMASEYRTLDVSYGEAKQRRADTYPRRGPRMDTSGRWRSRRVVRLALAFSTFVLLGITAGAGGVLLPAQIDHYRIDRSVIGLLFIAFSAGYALAGASTGALLRRLGPRHALVSGATIFILASLAGGAMPPYAGLAATALFAGFGTGVLDAGLNAYVTTLRG